MFFDNDFDQYDYDDWYNNNQDGPGPGMWLLVACVAIVLFILVVVDEAYGQELAPARPAIHPVLMVTVGGSSPDPYTRQLGYNLPAKGWYGSDLTPRLPKWKAEFDKRDLPFRVLPHNPWGHDAQKWMDFDQAVEAAENPKLARVVNSFVAWLETEVRPLLGEDGECIIYLGCLDEDPDFLALKSNPRAYRERVAASLVDVPDWCSLAFDHSAKVTTDSIEWSVMLGELAGGRRIYCEARPHQGSATIGLPVICDAKFWWRGDPGRHADSRKWAAPYSDMQGAEVLLLVDKGDEAMRRAYHETTLREAKKTGDNLVPLFGPNDFWVLDEVVK